MVRFVQLRFWNWSFQQVQSRIVVLRGVSHQQIDASMTFFLIGVYIEFLFLLRGHQGQRLLGIEEMKTRMFYSPFYFEFSSDDEWDIDYRLMKRMRKGTKRMGRMKRMSSMFCLNSRTYRFQPLPLSITTWRVQVVITTTFSCTSMFNVDVWLVTLLKETEVCSKVGGNRKKRKRGDDTTTSNIKKHLLPAG